MKIHPSLNDVIWIFATPKTKNKIKNLILNWLMPWCLIRLSSFLFFEGQSDYLPSCQSWILFRTQEFLLKIYAYRYDASTNWCGAP